MVSKVLWFVALYVVGVTTIVVIAYGIRAMVT